MCKTFFSCTAVSKQFCPVKAGAGKKKKKKMAELHSDNPHHLGLKECGAH